MVRRMGRPIGQIIKDIEGSPDFIAGFINVLHQSTCVEQRYCKLIDLLPDSIFWEVIEARQLVFYLAGNYGLNFGVCCYYEIEMNDDGRQYCDIDGEEVECSCVIPQDRCVIKDEEAICQFILVLIF